MPNRSDRYGQFDRSPKLTPGDLQRGLGWLRTEAERGSPSARAVLAELDRLKAVRTAAKAVDRAWDAWMMGDDDSGQDAAANAIGKLREALRDA